MQLLSEGAVLPHPRFWRRVAVRKPASPSVRSGGCSRTGEVLRVNANLTKVVGKLLTLSPTALKTKDHLERILRLAETDRSSSRFTHDLFDNFAITHINERCTGRLRDLEG